VWQKIVSVAGAVARGIEWLSDNLGWISGAISFVMMFSILREVIGRYFFKSPTEWVMELSAYLLVASTYLGGAYTEMKEGHVRIDFLYMHFKGKVKKTVNIFIYIIGLCWCSVILWQGAEMAWESFVKNSRSDSTLMWPLFPSQAMIPIGAFLLCMILLAKLTKSISSLFQKKD